MLTKDEELRLDSIQALAGSEIAQQGRSDGMSEYIRLETVKWLAAKLKETNEELLRATEI